MIVVVILAILLISNHKSSYFIVENNEDGTISVTAQKAGAEAGGIGYITIAEGQKLSVRTNLTDKSSIKIEVLPGETDATTDVLMEETFTAVNADSFELPEGEYTIRITAEKGAEGTMEITAE